MKKLLTFLVFIIIFMSLYSTNPTSLDFKDFAKQYVRAEMQKSGVSNGGFAELIAGGISDLVVSYAVDTNLKKEDYFIFSIYTVGGLDREYKFLGIFRKFIPLKG